MLNLVLIFFGRVKSIPFHFCLISSFSSTKKEDETPNELVFLLRALLVCSLVLDCLQCYRVGDKDPRSYALGTVILGATCFGVWDTWISSVNLENADSLFGHR